MTGTHAGGSQPALASIMNPFLDYVVKDAWEPLASDVTAIHKVAFEQCLEAIRSAEKNRGYGVLIHGEPGAGKTHLLARLRTHLAETAGAAADRALRCIFVSVRLRTHASELWPHVRRRLAEDLQRRIQGLSQFQRLIAHQVAAMRDEPATRWVMAMRVLSEHDRETIAENAEAVAERLELDPSLSTVLRHLAIGERTRDAAAWLRGDALTNAAITNLGLPTPGDDPEPRATTAQRVVTSLCKLAGQHLPIVFCFDQIEALEPNDRASLGEFGRMAAELSDADANVAIISSIQSAYLDTLDDAIRTAHRDRIFRVRTVLDALEPAEVDALVRSKLDASPELSALGADRDLSRLFPFDEAFVKELADMPHCNPRRVLSRAAERFGELQHGAAAIMSTKTPASTDSDHQLETALEERRARATTRTAPRELFLHGLPILGSLIASDQTSRGDRPAATAAQSTPVIPNVDAVVETPRGPLSVIVLDQADMRAVWRPLQRVLDMIDKGAIDPRRLVLLRPGSLPIPSQAEGTIARLKKIVSAGGRFVEPSLEAMAALDALRSLVSDARAGDLGEHGVALAPTTVVEWLRRTQANELSALAHGFGMADEADETADASAAALRARENLSRLRAVIAEAHVMGAAEAAKAIALEPEEVIDLAARHPSYLGLLAGPPPVLFEIVGEPADAQEARS